MIILITKYNLSPKWVQLFLFLIFYYVLSKLHFFDINSNAVECMYTFKRDMGSVAFEKYKKIQIEQFLIEQKINAENLDLYDQQMKKYLFDHKLAMEKNEVLDDINCKHGARYYGEYNHQADVNRQIIRNVDPYLLHVIEHKQNYKALIEKVIKLEQTISNLESVQEPLKNTISEMQINNISKIQNLIYDFLPLKEENYMLRRQINGLEAQNFDLKFNVSRLINKNRELSTQLLNKEDLIGNLQRNSINSQTSNISSDQLEDIRLQLNNLSSRLSVQENNNSCTTS